MSNNKEYRKHEYGEEILYWLSDMIDDIDDCKENIRYWDNIEGTRNLLLKIKNKLNFIIEKLDK